jgi:hypothetical protein
MTLIRESETPAGGGQRDRRHIPPARGLDVRGQVEQYLEE